MDGEPPMRNSPKISRRTAIRELFAATVVTATGISERAHAGADRVKTPEEAKKMEQMGEFADLIKPKHEGVALKLAAHQKKLRSPSFRAVQANPEQAKRAVKEGVFDHPETRFDMLSDSVQDEIRDFYNRSTVWMVRIGNENTITVQRSGRLIGKELSNAMQRSARDNSSQGIVVRRGNQYYIATNMHGIKQLYPDPVIQQKAAMLEKQADTDIAYLKVSLNQLISFGVHPKDAIDIDDQLPQNFDLNGALVFCRGFDPDAFGNNPPQNPDPTGFKGWLGLANRMEAGMWNGVKKEIGETYDHLSRKGYVFPIPKGEAKRRDSIVDPSTTSPKPKYMYAQGMSAGPVGSRIGDKVRLVGIQFCAYPVEINGAEYSQSGFHALPEMVAALNEPRRTFEFPSLTGLEAGLRARSKM